MKNKKPSIHFSISEDKHTKLKEYATAYETSMNACVLEAIDLLFDQHGMDAVKYGVIKDVLDRHFVVPKVYSDHAFLTNLYLNAKAYPKNLASNYWDKIVYRSPIEKTNLDIYKEIKAEINRALRGKEN